MGTNMFAFENAAARFGGVITWEGQARRAVDNEKP